MSDTPRFERGHAQGKPDGLGAVGLDPEVQSLFEEFGEVSPNVAIVVANTDERSRMQGAMEELRARGIEYQLLVMAPHKTPVRLARFAQSAAVRGVRVIIASAGQVASLPAVLASLTELPVIGVPLSTTPLNGLDTLLAAVQVPDGAPVACMALDAASNAGIFASHILNAAPLPPR
jgi:5-(carboxyamino)imidazole ribonucleotide mutase